MTSSPPLIVRFCIVIAHQNAKTPYQVHIAPTTFRLYPSSNKKKAVLPGSYGRLGRVGTHTPISPFYINHGKYSLQCVFSIQMALGSVRQPHQPLKHQH